MVTPTDKHVAVVREYTDRRMRNDTRGVLQLVSETIALEGTLASARGKEAFGRYLDKNRGRGDWGAPYVKDGDHVAMDGAVKLAFLTLRLATRFYFSDDAGADGTPLIARIVVARAGKGN